MSIRLRLAIALAAVIALAGAALLAWTAHAQRSAAIAQARDFASGVHQITLAGLTGMMIAGVGERRGLFLDQIERANGIRALRVIRGERVAAQFGPGTPAEQPSDAIELDVLSTGRPVFEVRSAAGREFLRAVMPAVASRDFLGKDCLGCHHVAEGAVLGAVTLEVDLDPVNAAIATFRRDVGIAGLAFLLVIVLLGYAATGRVVSAPLATLSENLESIADGRVELDRRLVARGPAEVARAVRAFDRVLERTQAMIGEERVAADVFEHALEGILVTDASGRIIKVNPAFTRTTGYGADEAIGNNPRMLQSGMQDAAFYGQFWAALNTRGEWRGDIWNKRKNGEIYPERLNISCVRDPSGAIQNYVAIFSDVTEHKRQEALITYQAQHDALTGLPNRTLFRDRLQQAIAMARRRGGKLAVMFADLDRFKHINDSLGHEAGDELLRLVSRRLRAAVRDADTVGRLGGDEFTVLLPEVDGARAAEAVAAKIIESIRAPCVIGGSDLYVSGSLGISLFPEHGDDPDALMKHADAAMYQVKERGRHGFRVYSHDLGEGAQRRLRLETDLHHALDRGELVVFYQPQRSVANGRLHAVEALLRWRHPSLGLLSAREFLPMLEESGLIIPAGEWALTTACVQAARWAAGASPVNLAVNLSERQLFHPGLVDAVQRALRSSGLAPARLELEVAEGAAMRDIDRTVAALDRLSQCGVRLALSEFGMGLHSALGMLRRLRIDSVKIDRSLVRDMPRDPEAFNAALSLAHGPAGAGMRVVAVGVESREQLEILQATRCNAAQGRYLGIALSAGEITALLDGSCEAG